MIKLDPDIIKPNILSKFEKVWVKTVFAAFGKRNTIKPFLNFERVFVINVIIKFFYDGKCLWMFC